MAMSRQKRVALNDGEELIFNLIRTALGPKASEGQTLHVLLQFYAEQHNLMTELLHNGRKPIEERIEANLKVTT